jgi:hypothetical protein
MLLCQKKSYLCKILFMLYDSNAFKPYIFFVLHNIYIYIYIYILLALCQNPLDIEFSGGFWNCRGSFHRTCLAPGLDMFGSQVSQVYKEDPVPLGTLASFFHPISCVCDGWALPRRFGASSTKTPRFLGDLTLLLRIFKP